MPRRIFDTRRVVWLFPAPVRTAQTHQPEVGSGSQHHGGFVHHILVRYVAVGEDNLIHPFILDKPKQIAFRVDRDALGIPLSRQGGRVGSIIDVGNLGGSERHDLVFGVVAEEHVEVMKIASGGAHD
jgi:hypothetical protein